MKKLVFLVTFSALPLFLQAEETDYSEITFESPSNQIESTVTYSNVEIEIDNKDHSLQNNSVCVECERIRCEENGSQVYQIQTTETVQTIETSIPVVSHATELSVDEPFEEGNFLPEINPFFPTILAQPHIIGYSAGYRSYDKIFKSTLPVSIGDQFSLYQIKIDPYGRLYFGIEACVWAVFEAKTKSLSLINADYYIALPLTYVNHNFSARLRLFHQSSHLGDEFLLENEIVRVNPSEEGLDFSMAYEPLNRLTFFLGYTRILRSDDSFKIKPNNVYYGFNYFFDFAKIESFCVEGIPYVAAFCTNNENNNWNLDSTIALGYQWEKHYGHKLRICATAHQGYSAEGQFARKKSKYVSINLLYGN